MNNVYFFSLFIDIKKEFVFYFDSTGDKIPRQIKQFITKICNQYYKLFNKKLSYINNYNIEHQEENTECGIYCLYFIISLLTETKNHTYFLNNKITDKDMEKVRYIYFTYIN